MAISCCSLYRGEDEVIAGVVSLMMLPLSSGDCSGDEKSGGNALLVDFDDDGVRINDDDDDHTRNDVFIDDGEKAEATLR